MSVAKLPSGVFLYYTDSGKPATEEKYDTFVIVHGVAYNAGRPISATFIDNGI